MQPFPGLERWSRTIHLPGNQTNLHFYDTGVGLDTAQNLILLHGLGDEADTWRHILPRLTGRFRVIALDLPGFGQSEKKNRKYTIPFFCEVLLEFCELLSIPSAVLAGHSTGAIIAHQFAIENSGRVAKLILIGGSLVSKETRINPGFLVFLAPGLGEWSYNRLRKNPQAAYQTLEPYYNHIGDLPEKDREFLFQRVNERVWSDGQRQAFLSTLRNMALWLPSQQKSLPEQMAGWPVPTMVIWGEKDQVNPVQNAHALIEFLPSAQLIIVPDAGHNVQQEKPVEIAAAITAKTGRF
jgi:pimeloyl-ACP methyl ester carboxylesterase